MSLGLERVRERLGFGSRAEQTDRTIDGLVHEHDRLRALLRRITGLHHAVELRVPPNQLVCAECDHDWPCPTRQLLDEEGY